MWPSAALAGHLLRCPGQSLFTKVALRERRAVRMEGHGARIARTKAALSAALFLQPNTPKTMAVVPRLIDVRVTNVTCAVTRGI